MTGPVDDVLEKFVEEYLARRTAFVRDKAYALAYAVHFDVTVQVDATAGDPEVLVEQRGIIPLAMTDLSDIEDDSWREQCHEIELQLCPEGWPEVAEWKHAHPLGFSPPEWEDGQLIFRYNPRAIATCTLALEDAQFERYVTALFRWIGRARELDRADHLGCLRRPRRGHAARGPHAYEILTTAHPNLKPSEIFGS